MKFLGRGWRRDLETVASSARKSFLVAAPFIKVDEARWLRSCLKPGVDVWTLSSITHEAVSSAALDLGALQAFADVSPGSRITAVPGLHAKVYVADEGAAIVTSGNLTKSGLDLNLEYGALFDNKADVRRIRGDLLAHARLGSAVEEAALAELLPIELELRAARRMMEEAADADSKRRFREIVRRARWKFASMEIGKRTINAVFGEAILLILRSGPLTTEEIYERVRAIHPSLCDDEELVIKGDRYGKRWKHGVRNAQTTLKKRGLVRRDPSTGEWLLGADDGSSPPTGRSGGWS